MHDGYFGAAGDLTKRLLLPALYNLARTELLPANFALIGVDRLEMSDDAYRQHLDAAVRAFAADKHYSQTLDEAHWGELLKRISYLPGDFSDPQAYGHLKHKLAELRQSQVESDSVLFYLAVGARFLAVSSTTSARPACWSRPRVHGAGWWWRSLLATMWRRLGR